MNTINVISPYRWRGMWVFTDPAVGLKREPFVAGADTVIDMATRHIPNAGRGFTLIFSGVKFPTAQLCLRLSVKGNRKRGNTYRCDELGLDAWLCPALYKYFDSAPKRIWAEFRAKENKHEKKDKERTKTVSGSGSEWYHIAGDAQW